MFIHDPQTSNNAHTGLEQAQRARPISWGSSGRRFKSCQPDRRSEAVFVHRKPPLFLS